MCKTIKGSKFGFWFKWNPKSSDGFVNALKLLSVKQQLKAVSQEHDGPAPLNVWPLH